MRPLEAPAVLEAARRRSDALVRRDEAALRAILTDDFVYTNASGDVMDKDGYLERHVESGTMVWTAQHLDEAVVRFHGDTAILTCRVHDLATFAGDPFEGFFRSTLVWIRQGGDWRCAAIQTTEIA
jgi:ketosteroid isomerase-like protein